MNGLEPKRTSRLKWTIWDTMSQAPYGPYGAWYERAWPNNHECSDSLEIAHVPGNKGRQFDQWQSSFEDLNHWRLRGTSMEPLDGYSRWQSNPNLETYWGVKFSPFGASRVKKNNLNSSRSSSVSVTPSTGWLLFDIPPQPAFKYAVSVDE